MREINDLTEVLDKLDVVQDLLSTCISALEIEEEHDCVINSLYGVLRPMIEEISDDIEAYRDDEGGSYCAGWAPHDLRCDCCEEEEEEEEDD